MDVFSVQTVLGANVSKDKYMVSSKNAKINGLYFLREEEIYSTVPKGTNIWLVVLTAITDTGAERIPIIVRLLKLRPDFGVMQPMADGSFRWSELYNLKHKDFGKELKVVLDNPDELVKVIFEIGY